jgi:hypothetical protein
MIFIKEPIKAYVSKIEKKQYWTIGTVSTSRKKEKDSTDYIKSFWNAKFKSDPTEGKITITKAFLTNEKADNGKYYVNMTVLEFEQEAKAGFTPVDDSDSDGLPF